MPWTSNGSPMMRPTVMRGFSETDRVLKNDLHPTTQRFELRPIGVENVLPVERDVARGLGDQPKDRPPDGGLAATGFANQAKRLARMDLQRHAIDRPHVAHGATHQPASHGEVRLEVSHVEQGSA